MHGQGWNGLKARTYGEPGRMGRRASNMSLGANGTLIPIMGVIGDNGIFPVTDRTLFKGRSRSCRDPFTGTACHDYIGYNILSPCRTRSMLEHTALPWASSLVLAMVTRRRVAPASPSLGDDLVGKLWQGLGPGWAGIG